MTTTTVRYLVDDLASAVDFYRDLLGFEEELRPSPSFAMLYRGDLRLLLSVPGSSGSGGAPLSDGTLPEPGGWNRFALKVPDLDATVRELRGKGAGFRNDIVTGVGVKQILLQDPAGNLVELFQPLAAYHERPQQQTTS
jgi:catechol 2,3-dioxygenase-like lactoylglutathione lyase family enzyme